MENKLQTWKGSLLSPAGRRALIQLAISSISYYWLGHQAIPKKEQKSIVQIQRNFLWRGANHHMGYNVVAWSQMSKAICEGGMRIRDWESHCKAFRANTLRRFLTQPNSMWVDCYPKST